MIQTCMYGNECVAIYNVHKTNTLWWIFIMFGTSWIKNLAVYSQDNETDKIIVFIDNFLNSENFKITFLVTWSEENLAAESYHDSDTE